MVNQMDQFTVERVGDSERAVLKLTGELDLAAVPVLEEELRKLDESTPTQYVIDLSGLTFVDSSGLAAIYRAQMTARTNGHTLAFRRGSARVQRLLQMTGLTQRLSFEDEQP
jgi:anti-anti-sigma factor